MQIQVTHFRTVLTILTLALGACAEADSPEQNRKGFQAGLTIRDEATAADVGLPAYPGAQTYSDGGDDTSGGNVQLSVPFVGVKVVAVDLETGDAPEKVAKFYAQALSKYGSVLECRKGQSKRSGANHELTCDNNDPGEHTVVYKVGTEENQRIVAIKTHGRGTRFSLVHVVVRDEAEDEA